MSSFIIEDDLLYWFNLWTVTFCLVMLHLGNFLNKLSIKSYITLCFNKPDESVFWSNNNVLKAESTLHVSDQLVFAVVWN